MQNISRNRADTNNFALPPTDELRNSPKVRTIRRNASRLKPGFVSFMGDRGNLESKCPDLPTG
jgi:hypothetical protein